MSPRAAWRLESMGYDAYDFVAGKAAWTGMGLPYEGDAARVPDVGELADRDVPTCSEIASLEETRAALERSGAAGCVVVNDRRVVLGWLTRDSAEGEGHIARDVMHEGPTTVRPDEDVHDLFHRMEHAGARQVIVTTLDGRLVGILGIERLRAVFSDHEHHH